MKGKLAYLIMVTKWQEKSFGVLQRYPLSRIVEDVWEKIYPWRSKMPRGSRLRELHNVTLLTATARKQ